MTYVLIDLENVMPDDFSRLNREDVRTYLFTGKMQERIASSSPASGRRSSSGS